MRSSRSRSPVRGRSQRTPLPPQGGAPTPRRPYGAIPDGPRNGVVSPRTPVVFPKVEASDVMMRDVMARQAAPVRESSIASTHVPSHQVTPSRIPQVPRAMIQAAPLASTSESTSPVLPPTADAIKSMLESSQLQWQQISSAVAAATSAVPKTNAPNATSGDLSAEEKQKIWTSRIE